MIYALLSEPHLSLSTFSLLNLLLNYQILVRNLLKRKRVVPLKGLFVPFSHLLIIYFYMVIEDPLCLELLSANLLLLEGSL